MLAEQTEVVKKREAADHCISFRPVGPRMKSRNGAAAVDKAIAKRVGNDPVGGSNIVVCTAVTDKEESIGVEEGLVELLGSSGVKVDPPEEHCIVVWERGNVVAEL
jgi:hypothetical protein